MARFVQNGGFFGLLRIACFRSVCKQGFCYVIINSFGRSFVFTMPFNLRRPRRRLVYQYPDSSGSDTYVPLYKRERIEQSRKIQKRLKKLDDNDSPLENNSEINVISTKGKDTASCTNVIDQCSNVENDKKQITHRGRISRRLSALNSTSSDASNGRKRRHTRNKKNATISSTISYDSEESSCDSSASLFQSKRKYLRSFNVNKHGNKSNKDEAEKSSQAIENETNEKNHSESNFETNTLTKENKEETKKKQDVPLNFKSYIIKTIDELKHKFSEYKLQTSHLEQKYMKEETVTLQDAADMIFILDCFISKLKEELTEQQQELTNSYIQRSMKHNCEYIVSKAQYKRFVNNNHLQVLNEHSSSSSSENRIFSPTPYRETPLKVIKTLRKNEQANDKYLMSQADIRSDKTELSLKKHDSIIIAHNNNNEDNLQSVQSKSVILKSSKDTENNSETLTQQHAEQASTIEQDFSRNPPIIEINHSEDDDSDIYNIYTTSPMYPLENENAQQIRCSGGTINAGIDRCKNRLKCSVSDISMFEDSDDEANQKRPCNTDSAETVIIPNNRIINNSRDSQVQTENLISEP